MRVEVTLFATLGAYRPEGLPPAAPAFVELAEGSTLAALAKALAIPAEAPYVALVNGSDASGADRLSDGDSVVLFPPLMGGGS